MNPIFIIVIIGLVVWFLQWLFRTADENKTRERARGSSRPSGSSRPRKPASDLDRYLEDTRRDRQEDEPIMLAEVVGTTPVQRKAPEKRRPTASPTPARPSTIDRPPLRQRDNTPEKRRVGSPQFEEPILLEVASPPAPVEPPAPRRPREERRPGQPQEVRPSLQEATPAPKATAPTVPRALTPDHSVSPSQPRSPAVVALARLLRSRHSTQAALLLGQILSSPLSRQPRQGGPGSWI